MRREATHKLNTIRRREIRGELLMKLWRFVHAGRCRLVMTLRRSQTLCCRGDSDVFFDGGCLLRFWGCQNVSVLQELHPGSSSSSVEAFVS